MELQRFVIIVFTKNGILLGLQVILETLFQSISILFPVLNKEMRFIFVHVFKSSHGTIKLVEMTYKRYMNDRKGS